MSGNSIRRSGSAPPSPPGVSGRVIESLDESECLRLLGGARVGRLATPAGRVPM